MPAKLVAMCPWARHLMGCLYVEWLASMLIGSNRWQLDFKDRKGPFAVSWSRYLDK